WRAPRSSRPAGTCVRPGCTCSTGWGRTSEEGVMDCPTARDRLLEADAPARPEDDLRAHLDVFPDCRRLAGGRERLGGGYRAALAPAAGREARDASLARRRRPRAPLVRWAAAAAVLVAVGGAVWSLWPAPRANAADVVERLIDWNLALSEAK